MDRPLNILVLGKTKSHTGTMRFLAKGFADLGHKALFLNPRRALSLGRFLGLKYLALRFSRPDLVIAYHATVPGDWLAALGERAKTVLYYEDFDATLRPEVVELGRTAHHFILTNEGQLEEYKSRGVRDPHFLPGACAVDAYEGPTPREGMCVADVAFIGSAGGKGREDSRVPIVKAVAERFDLALFGEGWADHGLKPRATSVEPPLFGQICRGAKIVLGVDVAPAPRAFTSNRMWLVLGSGGFFLTRFNAGLDSLVTDCEHLAFFRDRDDLLGKIEEYLPQDALRKRIAESGRALVRDKRTMTHLAREILNVAGLDGVSVTR